MTSLSSIVWQIEHYATFATFYNYEICCLVAGAGPD